MLHNQRYACYERVPDNIENDRQLLKYVYNVPIQSTPIISLSTWFQSDMQQKTALKNFDNCLWYALTHWASSTVGFGT